MKVNVTPYAHLTDDEYLETLYTKEDPDDFNLESAARIEMLLASYRALLEQVHTAAVIGLQHDEPRRTLERLRDLTAPAVGAAAIQ